MFRYNHKYDVLRSSLLDLYYRNIAAVLDGTEELRVKPEEAMRGMLVMEAAFASDRTGEAIKVNI